VKSTFGRILLNAQDRNSFYYESTSCPIFVSRATHSDPRLWTLRCRVPVCASINFGTLHGSSGNRPTTIECKAKGVYDRGRLTTRRANVRLCKVCSNPDQHAWGIDGRDFSMARPREQRLAKSKPIIAPSLGAMWAKPAPLKKKSNSQQISEYGAAVSQVDAIWTLARSGPGDDRCQT